MNPQFTRTALLLGEEKIENLHQKKVAIFGIGGVGGYVCEALVRAGVGHFELFDHDVVDCVDTVTAKLEIITRCNAEKIPVISSMGTGNKLTEEEQWAKLRLVKEIAEEVWG